MTEAEAMVYWNNYIIGLGCAYILGMLTVVVVGLFKQRRIAKEDYMQVREFAVKVSKMEGKKKQVDIAQISEVLRCINTLTKGKFYKMIRAEE